MSLFDPFAINKRRVRKTHNGQVLRQKPNKMPEAYSREDLERAKVIAQSYGYRLVDRNYVPPSEPLAYDYEPKFLDDA